MPHVFISYFSSDAEADAGRLYDSLSQHLESEQLYKDDRLELGGLWERDVERALSDCAALLVVMGPDWEPSPPLELELSIAASNGIPIVPVLVRGADIKELTQGLRGTLSDLSKRTALQLDHRSWSRDLVDLIDVVRRVVGDPSRARVIIEPPDPEKVLDKPPSNNEKALAAHAEDLAECLDDPQIKMEAESARGRFDEELAEQAQAWGAYRKVLPRLAEIVKVARQRLCVEQYARVLVTRRLDRLQDAVQLAEELADYLEDPSIAAKARQHHEGFREAVEDYKNGGMTSSQEIGEEKAELESLIDAAQERLRARLPGITKETARRKWPANAFRDRKC